MGVYGIQKDGMLALSNQSQFWDSLTMCTWCTWSVDQTVIMLVFSQIHRVLTVNSVNLNKT